MKRTVLPFSALVVALLLNACSESTATAQVTTEVENPKIDSTLTPKNQVMNSYISMVEIPVTNISRAIEFYQAIMGITIEKMEMEGMEMGILPYENQAVHIVLMKSEEGKPSADGVMIYLNGGDNLQVTLDKVEQNGGAVIVPKTAHADESGYFALFIDSEGNKIGLNSPN